MKDSRINKSLASIIIISCLLIVGCGRVAVKTGPTVAPKIRSLVSLPRSKQEFVSIFGDDATDPQWKSVIKNREKFSQVGAELLNSRHHLLTLLKDDTSDIVLLVGHNVEGRFIFPDGSSVHLDEISGVTSINRIVVLISCNSVEFASENQIGISRKITYYEANIILNRMLKNLNIRTDLDTSNQNYHYTVSEVERMVQDADQRANVYYTVRKSGPYVAGGSLITYIVVESRSR